MVFKMYFILFLSLILNKNFCTCKNDEIKILLLRINEFDMHHFSLRATLKKRMRFELICVLLYILKFRRLDLGIFQEII